MNLDIRTPMTLMFGVLGVILTINGFLTRSDPAAQERSLGININLWWGLVLIAFAIAVFIWAKVSKEEINEAPKK